MKIRSRSILMAVALLGFLVVTTASVAAYPGDVDHGFGSNGSTVTDLSDIGNDKATDAVALPDDSVVLAGSSDGNIGLVKYLADGSLDSSFGPRGWVRTIIPGGTSLATSIASLPDGKLLVAGSYAGDFVFLRYNSNGTLDQSFGNSGMAFFDLGRDNDQPNEIVVQSDGKIVAAGYSAVGGTGDSKLAVVRINSNGSPDATFGNLGQVLIGPEDGSYFAAAVALASDGKILVGGSSGFPNFYLTRLNVNGSVDLTFGLLGVVEISSGPSIEAIAVQSDGKIVAGGGGGYNLFRFNASGSLDDSFEGDGRVNLASTLAVTRDLLVQPAGKIVAGGGGEAARFTESGSLDNTFGDGGVVALGDEPLSGRMDANSFAPRSGGLVAAGSKQGTNGEFDFAAQALFLDGQLDGRSTPYGFVQTNFGNSNEIATGLEIASDGTLLTSGWFVDDEDKRDMLLSKHSSSGYLVSSTRIDIGEESRDGAMAIALQADGKVILAGYTDEDFAVVRLRQDGELDPGFGDGGKVVIDFGGSDRALATGIYPDGRILLAGWTGVSDGSGTVYKWAIARLTSAGLLDDSFEGDGRVISSFGGDAFITSVEIQPDGKIVVGGSIEDDFAVGRYLEHGSFDAGFAGSGRVFVDLSDGGFDLVNDLAILSDGRIVAGGESIGDIAITRLGSTGIVDESFTNFVDFYGEYDALNSLAIDAEGYVIGTGEATLPDGRSFIATLRFDSEGFLDPDFGSGSGYASTSSGENAAGFSTRIQPDGKIVVAGGAFGGFQKTDDIVLARFDGTTGPSGGGGEDGGDPGGDGGGGDGGDGGGGDGGDPGGDGDGGGDEYDFELPPSGAKGYWLVAGDGGIFVFGEAGFFGSTGAMVLNKPVVGMAGTASGNGYWLVASDGGIFSFGDAQFYGSTGAMRLNKPIVGMTRTASGNGYWLVASDGGIFSFGDAQFYGSTGAMVLNKPVVGMARTPSGNGYWLVASDGGVFSFGDANFYGSTGNIRLNQPIVSLAPGPHGEGYWFVAADGGIFSFGGSSFYGSTGGFDLGGDIVGMAPSPSGTGYWMVGEDGEIYEFGDAEFFGSMGGIDLKRPIVGMAVK